MGRQMIAKMERAKELMNQTESDIRLKIAMKDRLPREPMRSVDIGDEVTFRDHKEKKMRVGTVTGLDGSLALVKWCNHERRVPHRELMPLKERRDLLEDGDTDIDSAEEIIEEIIPERQIGPLRKKKVEIIPCPTSVEIERELRERPRLEDVLSDESDHLPKYKIVTDSEEENIEKRKKKKKKPKVVINERPNLRREVRLKMKSGKVIKGRVSHVEKKDKDWFFVDDGETKYIPIDMKGVDE